MMIQRMKGLFRQPVELEVREAYEKWAPNYPAYSHNQLMILEERTMLGLLPETKGEAALDLACGSGRYLRLLKERGASPVIGLDLSQPMLERAREISHNLIQADLRWISLDASRIRLVTCGLALGHIPRLAQALCEISRVLAPGGAVVYSDLHPSGSSHGWKRTFRGGDGKKYVAKNYVHPFSDHLDACKLAGLQIEEVREPYLDSTDPRPECPALLVVRARKPNG